MQASLKKILPPQADVVKHLSVSTEPSFTNGANILLTAIEVFHSL